jgi:cell wall-associated NlpC family hydrolase
MDFLQTGDIILFSGTSWISYLLTFFGRCPYSHVGMIVRNPHFLNPDLEDGIYLLESGWNNIPDSENHIIKTGVQLHFLSDILETCTKRSVYVRKIECVRDPAFYQTLCDLHTKINNQPYDLNPWDWIRAEYNLFSPFPLSDDYQITNRYWCSSLLAYLFYHLELIQLVNWSMVAPREFSEHGSQLRFRCGIGKEELLW